jgi:hypothetical protein
MDKHEKRASGGGAVGAGDDSDSDGIDFNSDAFLKGMQEKINMLSRLDLAEAPPDALGATAIDLFDDTASTVSDAEAARTRETSRVKRSDVVKEKVSQKEKDEDDEPEAKKTPTPPPDVDAAKEPISDTKDAEPAPSTEADSEKVATKSEKATSGDDDVDEPEHLTVTANETKDLSVGSAKTTPPKASTLESGDTKTDQTESALVAKEVHADDDDEKEEDQPRTVCVHLTKGSSWYTVQDVYTFLYENKFTLTTPRHAAYNIVNSEKDVRHPAVDYSFGSFLEEVDMVETYRAYQEAKEAASPPKQDRTAVHIPHSVAKRGKDGKKIVATVSHVLAWCKPTTIRRLCERVKFLCRPYTKNVALVVFRVNDETGEPSMYIQVANGKPMYLCSPYKQRVVYTSLVGKLKPGIDKPAAGADAKDSYTFSYTRPSFPRPEMVEDPKNKGRDMIILVSFATDVSAKTVYNSIAPPDAPLCKDIK